MTESPSQFLMEMLRVACDSVGVTMAELSEATDLSLDRVEAVMEGCEPITVDEFILLALELEIGLDDLGLPMVPTALEPVELSSPGHGESRSEGLLAAGEAVAEAADPLGNQVAQTIQLGFGLGCDIFFVADSSKLVGSGLPDDVLGRFSDQMPIRLDGAFHRHMAPKYSEEGLTLVLSFGSLYTCCIPWDAFTQVTLYPVAPVSPQPSPVDPEPSPRSHLRLVE